MEKGHSMEVSRFGLEFNPFLKNSKEILVETAQYREALFRLSYLAKTKGFGLLTGGAGQDHCREKLGGSTEPFPLQGGLFLPLHAHRFGFLPQPRGIPGRAALLPQAG